MENILTKQIEALDDLTARVEKECGFKNAAWIISFILLFMDTKTWTVDKSYVAKLYQAIDMVEKDEKLKLSFQNVDQK